MVICNSCAGAFCYQNKELNISYQYNNPFISCGIFAKDWLLLLKNFDKINFLNIEINNTKYPLSDEISNYVIVDNLIQIWFPHYNDEESIRWRWFNRTERLLKYLEENKDWKNKILFVSNSYEVDTDEELREVAEDFPDLNQIIDVYSREELYEKINPSKNTILFNKQSKKIGEISKYIILNHFNYIKNDYETKK